MLPFIFFFQFSIRLFFVFLYIFLCISLLFVTEQEHTTTMMMMGSYFSEFLSFIFIRIILSNSGRHHQEHEKYTKAQNNMLNVLWNFLNEKWKSFILFLKVLKNTEILRMRMIMSCYCAGDALLHSVVCLLISSSFFFAFLLLFFQDILEDMQVILMKTTAI